MALNAIKNDYFDKGLRELMLHDYKTIGIILGKYCNQYILFCIYVWINENCDKDCTKIAGMFLGIGQVVFINMVMLTVMPY